MGRVQRYKKYKSIDPFSKGNAAGTSNASPSITSGQEKVTKSKKRANEEYNLPPKQADDDQLKYKKLFKLSDHKGKGVKRKKQKKGGRRKDEGPLKMNPGESKKQYFNRLDSEVGKAIQKAMTDIKGLRTKRKEHLKERDDKKKNTKMKKMEEQKMETKFKKDEPKFGEVAYEPPVLSLPRKASKKSDKPGLKLAHLMAGDVQSCTTVPKKRRKEMSELEKRTFDSERENAIKHYRVLKARSEKHLKIESVT